MNISDSQEIRRFKIFTFGCQMNEDDSNKIRDLLILKGFTETDSDKNADIILINTCTVRQHAEDKAFSLAGSLKKWKKSNKILIVMGCAVERSGELMKKRFPYIDHIVGAKSYERVFKIIEEIPVQTSQSPKEQPKPIYSSYQTISKGCSMNCSYCIVPSVRGPLRHIAFDKIIKEVKEKAEQGSFEITLLGQTVNAYRYENYDFVDLIKALSDIEKIKVIKFMSPHPLFFNKSFFKEYEKNRKISRHIHIPLQSGSDRILKAMKRGYTYDEFKKMVNMLREADPLTSLTTDIIVGFTGETNEDFLASIKAVEELGFSKVYCFKYSPRFSDRFLKDISDKEIEKRHSIMLSKAKEVAANILESKKGSIEDVIVWDFPYGKTISDYNCCIIDNKEKLNAGDVIKAEIVNAKPQTLIVRRIYDT
ncbi:MAG: MiaB/RimO family radical SAM methylthiotransferase [Elusimicrobiales bacterium]